jgi:hypothetical protein
MVEELVGRTRNFLEGVIADYIQRSLDNLLRRALGWSLRYAISAALFVMAAAFLLLGSSEGLILSGLPRFAAHLIIGAAALLGGIICLKCHAPSVDRK